MTSVNDLLFNEEIEEEEKDQRSNAEIRMEYLLKQGFSRDNIEMKTDLSNQAIKAISKGLLHASIFSDSTIKQLCETVMVLNVSKDRKGRKELTELSQVMNTPDLQTESSVLGRLLG